MHIKTFYNSDEVINVARLTHYLVQCKLEKNRIWPPHDIYGGPKWNEPWYICIKYNTRHIILPIKININKLVFITILSLTLP